MEYLARRRTCHTFVWIEYLNSYGATRLISLNVSTCIAAKRVSQPSNLYSNSSSNRLRLVFSIRFSPSNNISPTSQKSVEIRGNWDHGCVQAPQIPERKRKLANLPTTVTFRKSLSPAPCIIGLQSSKRDPALNWLHYRKITNGHSGRIRAIFSTSAYPPRDRAFQSSR